MKLSVSAILSHSWHMLRSAVILPLGQSGHSDLLPSLCAQTLHANEAARSSTAASPECMDKSSCQSFAEAEACKRVTAALEVSVRIPAYHIGAGWSKEQPFRRAPRSRLVLRSDKAHRFSLEQDSAHSKRPHTANRTQDPHHHLAEAKRQATEDAHGLFLIRGLGPRIW
jgi:hypothetical protein